MTAVFLTFPIPALTPDQAMAIDQDSQALMQTFRALQTLGLGQLRVPRCWGGQELGLKPFYQTQVNLSRASGALAFLQTQHQSACGLFRQIASVDQQATLFPAIAAGQLSLGIGVSHLRHRPPTVQAIPGEGGYRLTGNIPWVTGYGVFDQYLGGAVLPNQDILYGWFPFQADDPPRLRISPPLPLAAMQSTNTVTVTFDDWFLPDSQVIAIQPAPDFQQPQPIKISHHAFFALGCAQASLDLLQQQQRHRPSPTLDQAIAHFHRASQNAEAALFDPLDAIDDLPIATALTIRAQTIQLCQQLSQAAIIATGGASNRLDHPAQRLYRESLMFSISGQTDSIRDASLAQFLSA